MGSLMHREEDELRIAERAAQWQSVLIEANAAQRAEFMAWLEESPRLVREFLLMQAMDIEAAGIDREKRIDVDALLAQTSLNVVPLQGRSAPPTGRFRRRSWPWAAGVATLGIALGLASWQHGNYATATGEQRSIELPDGSLIQLNTQSRVKVDFSDDTREVRLIQGEALFKVAHDTARPFRVHIDGTIVRAVGTQFNIDRRDAGTMVSVLEGRVAISGASRAAALPREFAAGEAALVTSTGKIARAPIDTAQTTAWRQRRLIFRETPLASIATEFNRYNRTPELIVQGAAARARRYGGIFDADDPESFVAYLAQDERLVFEKQSERILIRER
jgi:transmembrane sensor